AMEASFTTCAYPIFSRSSMLICNVLPNCRMFSGTNDKHFSNIRIIFPDIHHGKNNSDHRSQRAVGHSAHGICTKSGAYGKTPGAEKTCGCCRNRPVYLGY